MADPWDQFERAPDRLVPSRAATDVDIEVGFPQAGVEPQGWDEFEEDAAPTVADQFEPETGQSIRSTVEQVGRSFGMAGRDVLNAAGGAADLVTLPITAILNLLGANIQQYRDLSNSAADSLGLPAPETTSEHIGSALTEGAISGGGIAGAASKVAPLLRGGARAVAEALAATPTFDIVSNAGGAAGAETARQAGGGPIAQLFGALAGGFAPLAAGGAAMRAPSLLHKNRTPNELSRAASDLGIDILPADAGGTTTRRFAAAAAQGPLSAAPIVKAGQRIVEQARTARDKIASAFGTISNPETAGTAAREGAEKYIKSSGAQGRRFYDRAAEMAGDARIQLDRTKALVDDQIARLESVPGGGTGLADAKAFRAALDNPDGFAVQGVRDMRTEMFVAPELRGGPVEARMKAIVSAASEDMEAGLRAQGNEAAADAFRAADDFWKDRLNTIDKVLQSIIGKPDVKGGEAVYKSIDAAARGDAERLRRLLKALPEEEAGIVRATLIGRMGRSAKGAQNADGDAFSLSSFLTHWNDLSPRSKSILFPSEHRAAIEKLAKVADASKQAERFANHSNTTGGIAGQIVLSGGVGLGISFPALGAALGAQYGAGRLLASPRFARWLASAPKKPNGPATLAHINRLTAIASAEPTIANEVLRLQETLASAFAQSPRRSAAEEPDQ